MTTHDQSSPARDGDVYLVFCTQGEPFDDDGRQLWPYQWFAHEADVLLFALSRGVHRTKTLTAEQALALWEPYKSLWPTMMEDYDPWDEEDAAFPSIEPGASTGEGDPPATNQFYSDVLEAGVPDAAEVDGDSPGSGTWFEMVGDAELTALRAALKGRYEIVVETGGGGAYLSDLDASEALELIAAKRAEYGLPQLFATP